MAYSAVITKRAGKDLRRMATQDANRVRTAVKAMAAGLPDRPTNWTAMGPNTTPAVEWGADGKIPVGKFRVLTIIDDSAQSVTIPRVFKRGDSGYGFSEDLDEDCGLSHEDEEPEEGEDEEEKRPEVQEDSRNVLRRILKGTST